jgi:hypothetical protein
MTILALGRDFGAFRQIYPVDLVILALYSMLVDLRSTISHLKV